MSLLQMILGILLLGVIVSYNVFAETGEIQQSDIPFQIGQEEKTYQAFGLSQKTIQNNFKRYLIGNITLALSKQNNIYLDDKNVKLYENYGSALEGMPIFEMLKKNSAYLDVFSENIIYMHTMQLPPQKVYETKIQNIHEHITFEKWMQFSKSWTLDWAEWYQTLTIRQKVGYLIGNATLNNIRYYYIRKALIAKAEKNKTALENEVRNQIGKLGIKVPAEWEECLDAAVNTVVEKVMTEPSRGDLLGFEDFEKFYEQ